MQLKLTGHHVELTPALRAHVENKLARLQRRFDQLGGVHCILTVEKLQHRAEATVSLNGTKIHADSVAEDMYAAVDGLIDKLVRRVRKHKEKLTGRNTRVAGRTHPGESG